jgi:CheY-like chemotaxis protein
MMKDLLSAYGANVDTFTSPKKALEAVGKNEYIIAFLDYYMPGCNGIELADAIRCLPDINTDMFIVCVTGYDDPHILREIELYTSNTYKIFDRYMRKPIDTSKIESILGLLSRDNEVELYSGLEFKPSSISSTQKQIVVKNDGDIK